jgi:superfamily I DNA and/or RNA helicase
MYKPSEITILSLYSGQLLTIKSKIKNNKAYPRDHPIHGVRVTTVDNYQGEENKIIILSLVRSNKRNSIGFLQASNRVCVALSRAIQGFYIFGNAVCIREAATKLSTDNNEHIWLKVLKQLMSKGKVVNELVVKCVNHSNKTCIK